MTKNGKSKATVARKSHSEQGKSHRARKSHKEQEKVKESNKYTKAVKEARKSRQNKAKAMKYKPKPKGGKQGHFNM